MKAVNSMSPKARETAIDGGFSLMSAGIDNNTSFDKSKQEPHSVSLQPER